MNKSIGNNRAIKAGQYFKMKSLIKASSTDITAGILRINVGPGKECLYTKKLFLAEQRKTHCRCARTQL